MKRKPVLAKEENLWLYFACKVKLFDLYKVELLQTALEPTEMHKEQAVGIPIPTEPQMVESSNGVGGWDAGPPLGRSPSSSRFSIKVPTDFYVQK